MIDYTILIEFQYEIYLHITNQGKYSLHDTCNSDCPHYQNDQWYQLTEHFPRLAFAGLETVAKITAMKTWN